MDASLALNFGFLSAASGETAHVICSTAQLEMPNFLAATSPMAMGPISSTSQMSVPDFGPRPCYTSVLSFVLPHLPSFSCLISLAYLSAF